MPLILQLCSDMVGVAIFFWHLTLFLYNGIETLTEKYFAYALETYRQENEACYQSFWSIQVVFYSIFATSKYFHAYNF